MNAPTSPEALRFNMIEQQIRPWNVLELDILELLSVVRREDYVPAAHRSMAFFDMELPLGDGREPGQCMLSPKVEARILQDLQVKPTDTVLEIGTGSGYMAALLAHRAARVLTLEIDEALIVRGRFTYQSGLAAAETLLQTPRRPTAIFASNDDMAAAVLAVAHGMRIYVPDELSVCGFDDTPVASTVWPQITTIHQPIAAMGRAAVTAMTEAIKAARAGRDHGPAHMTMKFSLIERGSAGPAPQLQIFRSQTEGGVLPR